MKRILTTTAAATIALAGVAFADGHLAQLETKLSGYQVEADLSTLSENEIAQLELALNGSTESPARTKGRIMRILDKAGEDKIMASETSGRMVIDISMTSLRAQVAERVEQWNVDCDVYALSDNQVAELYVGVTSSMTDADAINKAKAACQT